MLYFCRGFSFSRLSRVSVVFVKMAVPREPVAADIEALQAMADPAPPAPARTVNRGIF